MFCSACGAENPAHAQTCVQCAARLTPRCSFCDAPLSSPARFCPACGKPVKKTEEAATEPAGERKQVTVLFADFAGFTAFVHKQDIEDVRDYMSTVWTKLDSIILAHGGLIEKHIGDAIMAVFGAKQAREDDPVQAVRAGLAILQWLNELRPEGNQPRLQMRIGIHTGIVVVGPLGTTGEFAATGDTVNLANRLEGHAPPGGILVSHDTYRLVYGFFDVRSVAPFQVKGRTEPVEAYVVLHAKPRAVAAQLRGVEGIQTEMIGRERELGLMKSAFNQSITSGNCRVITLVGDAGVGKSCLLREFHKWADLLPQTVRLFYGRATPEMIGVPFALMRDVFFARFEMQDSDSPAVARAKLERGITTLLARHAGNGTAEEHQMQAHFIGQMLGLDFSSSPHLKDILQDADQIRQRAFHCFSRFFAVVSTGRTVAPPDSSCALGAGMAAEPNPSSLTRGTVLVAEDVHWGDDGSLDLLAHIARTCRDSSLLVVCLARPSFFERRPGWAEALPGHDRVNLEPLSRGESLALVASILRKTHEIPQALRELIVGGAEGVPFYLEEIIKMLIDQKVILPGPDEWHVEPARLAAARVPPTLTGVLQARLDGLPAHERQLLQRASIIGRVFWDSALQRIKSSDDAEDQSHLSESLDNLRRKELIYRAEGSAFAGAVEYLFKHDLLRSVAYESVLRKIRREHHAQAAEWLIERSGERASEFAGLIASHFEQAARLAEASAWYGRAGQQARAGYSPAAAIEYFRKALGLLPSAEAVDAGRRMEWQEGLSEALGAQARFAEALEACSGLKQLAEELGDVVGQARAWNGMAYLNERIGRNRVSVDCAERAEALARRGGANGRGELIRALLLKGWAFYRLSDAQAVLALADQTRELCTELGNRAGLATSHKLHGVAHLQLGHFGEADNFFKKGHELYEELGDRRNTAAMCSNLGESARLRGDYAAAEQLYLQALAGVRQIGNRDSEAIYLSNLAGARLGLGKFAQVESDAREAIALVGGPTSCTLSAAYSFLSEACLAQGKFAEALEAAENALRLAKESESDFDLGNAWRTLGLVAGAQNCTTRPVMADPRECFVESARVFDKIAAEGDKARTLKVWAEYELLQGDKHTAHEKSSEALRIFRRLGMQAEAVEAENLLQVAAP